MSKPFVRLSRFFLLLVLGCCLAGLSALGQIPNANRADWVYFGTYTNTTSHGIYRAQFDPQTGKLGPMALAAATSNPSDLAVSPDGRFLYAVNELEQFQGQASGAVSAFAIDRATGMLRLVNQVATRGTDPCYISLDASGKYVLVANYGSGSVAVFPRRADGSLGDATAWIQQQGSSVNRMRQAGPHAHFIHVTPNNRFALSADLGTDQILIYRFDARTGTLTPNQPAFIAVQPGVGPRHLAFSADGTRVYMVSEMGSTVTSFSFDPDQGALRTLQTVSSQPPGFVSHGAGAGAEIALAPGAGKFLYVSDRSSNTVSVFALQPRLGRLTLVQDVSSEGKTPRLFAIDPSGNYLWVANQNSASIVIFKIDTKTGKLSPFGSPVDLAFPVCVTFVPM